MDCSIFIPDEALHALAAEGRVDLEGERLEIRPEGCIYRVMEAVRVLEEVTTGEDDQGLVGKVVSRERLTDELGGELLGDSVLIDDNAYDVVPGFVCRPTSDLEPRVMEGRSEAELWRELSAVLG